MNARKQVEACLLTNHVHRAQQIARTAGTERDELLKLVADYVPPTPEPPDPKPQPTEFGLRLYPPDGLYDGEPCTCLSGCWDSCSGKCGCLACGAAYNDYLSSQD